MCVRNEKIKLIETNISKEKELIERINTILSVNQKKPSLNHYQIDTVTLNEIQVASIRFTGQYTELDKYIPLLYKADRKHLFSTLTYNYVHSRNPMFMGFFAVCVSLVNIYVLC